MAGLWRCSCCGEAMSAPGFEASEWRWDGVRFQHKCPGIQPQAGHFDCKWFGDDPPEGPGVPWSESPPDPVEVAIDTIIGSWKRWEGEAGAQAQAEQDPDAYRDVMAGHLRSVLAPLAARATPGE